MKKHKEYNTMTLHAYYTVSYHCIATFLSSILIFSVFLFLEERYHLENEKERALYIAKSYATTLSASINNASSMLYMMEALVIQGDGHVESFDHVAQDIIKNYPFTRNIILAPDGIIRFIYPLESEGLVLGQNILENPNKKVETEKSQKKLLTILGPMPLIQGGLGLVARLPIWGGPKHRHFWGMACLTMNFPALIEQTEISQLEKQGYAYMLWRYNPERTEKQSLAHSLMEAKAKPLEYEIKLPNALWVLSIAPIKGWTSTNWLLVRCIVGIFICLLLTVLTGAVCALLNKKRLLESISRTDALTQLPNRLRFSEYSDEALLHATRHKRILAVCFIDMNGFKRINDTFGHNTGDALLSNFAQRFAPLLRKHDFLARIGGDEFALLLEEDTEETLRTHLELLLNQLYDPVSIDGETHMLSLSIGVSLYPKDSYRMATLLRQADEAMYHAKSMDATYSFFNQDTGMGRHRQR